jgi:cell wall-associated NlpC family hydrolase
VRRSFLLIPLLVLLASATASALPPPGGGGGKPSTGGGKPSGGGKRTTTKSWADREIRVVTARGLMGGSVASFKPNAVLKSGSLARLVGGLTGRSVSQVSDPVAPVSLSRLDDALVRAVGLGGAAAALTRAARDAGLAPPSRFGTEVVARLLSLRINHPASQDDLELRPRDPVTRAETAYSAARVLGIDPGQAAAAQEVADTFALPAYSTWQRRVLAAAVRFIGFPYVWGGTSEKPHKPFKVQTRGGFDCSGFVWRVYKDERYPGGAKLSGVLRGRTTYQMSGEVPRSTRVPFSRLEPADLLFFGDRGTKSSPSQVGHMGIYLGEGWMIHSSGQGVAVLRLAGWYRQRFAWGRRPLAEAGFR